MQQCARFYAGRNFVISVSHFRLLNDIFVISNNPGYGLCGIAIPFDPAKFHVIMDEGLNEPLRSYGPASVGLSPYFTVNYDV